MIKYIELLINYKENTKNFNDKLKINDIFEIPIETLHDKITVNENIINDLELLNFKDNSNTDISNSLEFETNENLYYSLLEPNNIFQKLISNKWCKYYTTNSEFLNETQNLLKNFKNKVKFNTEISNNSEIYFEPEDKLYNSCEKIFYDEGFINKYHYIDIPYLSKYNNDETIMQVLSIHSLGSPIINLFIPIILLFLPFLIIKLQNIPITIEMYISHLKALFQNHIIGEFFLNFSEASISTKIYLIFSFGLYIFQMYQNYSCCVKYYKNIKYIHEVLFNIKNYIKYSLDNINNLLSYTNIYKSYNIFNNNTKYYVNILNNYYFELSKIKIYKINFNKLLELGYIMKSFYKLYNDENIIKSLYYSFGCNGYIQNITNIQNNIKKKNINFCDFIPDNSRKKTKFKNIYYGELNRFSDISIVKNSLILKNNLVLTGPNAAGKTTLLKSIIFNIILCQQIGCGFFDKASVKIYDFIHCYINIPDTSSRDSLFQAEAKRCKNILEIIKNNEDKKHLCVFDELYSGTNPEDAVISAYHYLNYINMNDNVNYILTTHYHNLCKKLKNEKTKNYHMSITETQDDFNFTYKLKKGICNFKGGIKIFKELEYPSTIINSIKSNNI